MICDQVHSTHCMYAYADTISIVQLYQTPAVQCTLGRQIYVHVAVDTLRLHFLFEGGREEGIDDQ